MIEMLSYLHAIIYQRESTSYPSQYYGTSSWEVSNLKNQIETLKREVSEKNDQIRRLEQNNPPSRNYSTMHYPYSTDVLSSNPFSLEIQRSPASQQDSRRL